MELSVGKGEKPVRFNVAKVAESQSSSISSPVIHPQTSNNNPRKQSINTRGSLVKPSEAGNHYTQVRAHYLRNVGGSDWGSECSDDVTMTNTFSIESVYTLDKIVASSGIDKFSAEITGFINRLNFACHNYNVVCRANQYLLRGAARVKCTYRILPFGGHRTIGKITQFRSESLSNILAYMIGWFLGITPFGALMAITYFHSLAIQFSCVYLLCTLFVLNVFTIYFARINIRNFQQNKFMVPVPINSEHLHGLRNYFKEVPLSNLTQHSFLKPAVHKQLMKELNSRANIPANTNVLFMFYSVEYWNKFIRVAHNKHIALLVFSAFCLIVGAILFVRKNV